MPDGAAMPLHAFEPGLEPAGARGFELDATALRLRRLAQRMADQAAPAAREAAEELLAAAEEAERALVERSRRIRQLENLSITDELTGLLNRRGFQEMLRRALADGERHGEEGLLLLCDLDHFKATNDSYGHLAGDSVLGAVAELLRRTTRRNDAVARLGGDEFAVLMPKTPVERAERLAAKLSAAVNGLFVPWGRKQIPVAASFGWESYGPNSRPDRLFFLADRKLYRCKRPQAPDIVGH
ncbi:MAG: GGDEF domain-containing protein [Tistlia sp.]|uniref:GGDEF domain-containing protein n=1 Tax=Tistlia sp. TaxID=3057121 RepID=UPI0034A16C3A